MRMILSSSKMIILLLVHSLLNSPLGFLLRISTSINISWELKPLGLPMDCSYLRESILWIFFNEVICMKQRYLVHDCLIPRRSRLMMVPLFIIQLNIVKYLAHFNISLIRPMSAMSLIRKLNLCIDQPPLVGLLLNEFFASF